MIFDEKVADPKSTILSCRIMKKTRMIQPFLIVIVVLAQSSVAGDTFSKDLYDDFLDASIVAHVKVTSARNITNIDYGYNTFLLKGIVYEVFKGTRPEDNSLTFYSEAEPLWTADDYLDREQIIFLSDTNDANNGYVPITMANTWRAPDKDTIEVLREFENEKIKR